MGGRGGPEPNGGAVGFAGGVGGNPDAGALGAVVVGAVDGVVVGAVDGVVVGAVEGAAVGAVVVFGAGGFCLITNIIPTIITTIISNAAKVPPVVV